MAMLHSPMAKMLKMAGAKICGDDQSAFTYQDYLYELLADGSDQKPISEKQWEMICDIQSNRKLVYASTVKHAIENIERKTSK